MVSTPLVDWMRGVFGLQLQYLFLTSGWPHCFLPAVFEERNWTCYPSPYCREAGPATTSQVLEDLKQRSTTWSQQKTSASSVLNHFQCPNQISTRFVNSVCGTILDTGRGRTNWITMGEYDNIRVEEKVVTIAKWPTDTAIIDYIDPNDPTKVACPRTMVLFIPGNPGLNSWQVTSWMFLKEVTASFLFSLFAC